MRRMSKDEKIKKKMMISIRLMISTTHTSKQLSFSSRSWCGVVVVAFVVVVVVELVVAVVGA